jgi:predicted nucleic acid-binding Zn ribbon protein
VETNRGKKKQGQGLKWKNQRKRRRRRRERKIFFLLLRLIIIIIIIIICRSVIKERRRENYVLCLHFLASIALLRGKSPSENSSKIPSH